MKIGIMLPQEWDSQTIDPVEASETMIRVAQEAEVLGLDSVWLFDHFHSTTSLQTAERMIFECWTSTAALARETSRVRIGQMVTCNSFRHPALLAKMASTVDVLSHGRLDLGLGAGWYQQEYLAYGYPFPETTLRLHQLREALQIIKAMWLEEEVHFEGTSYQLHGAINQPKGVQTPHIPLLIGGKGEQVTLKLVARYGDACNLTNPDPEEIKHKFALIKQYCQSIGRDENEIRRTIYVNGFLAETEAQAVVKARGVASKFSLDQIRIRGLVGTPETLGERLDEMEHLGVQEVIILLRDVARIKPLHLLAQGISRSRSQRR